MGDIVYLVLAASALLGQLLLFVPVVPVMLSAGALAHRGEVRLGWAALAVAAGVALGDYVWYRLGRIGGRRVLAGLCRVALERDTCLRRAESLFGRYGARALLVAKFIPGLSTVALPMAGAFGMRPRRFVFYDAIGVLLWTFAYAWIGYLSLGAIWSLGLRLPHRRLLLPIVALVVAGYLAWKYFARRRLARGLRMPRISADELHRRLGTVIVIDLRHPIDFETDPHTIPRALYIPSEDLPRRAGEIPRGREVVLYCTCPEEVTSALEARRLRAYGIERVRPLAGGFTAWRERGYPVEFRGPAVPIDQRTLNAA